MAQETPPTEADVVFALWRDETPAKLPGIPPSATPRRAAFLWLLALLVVAGVIVDVFAWIRPTPKPYLAPVWISVYQSRPLHTPPFSAQDSKALREGEYFTKGHIQFKAIANSSAGETVLLYLSGQAICDEKGHVLILPDDAELASAATARTLQSVLQHVADCRAQKKLLILDICWTIDDPYVGGLDDIASRIPDELAAVPDPARLVLVPCAPAQMALASPELGRSVFGYFLEDALRGWADYDASQPARQGLVTVHKLAEHVQTRVAAWAHAHNARQTPVLYGETADFPLVAIERSKPATHPSRAEERIQPDWLSGAWKARERWWTEERHRASPWLFRRLESEVFHADQRWRDGTDPDVTQKDFADTLERLDKQYARLIDEVRPGSLSLAQYRAAGKRPDDKLKPIVKDLFKKVAEARAAAPKPDEGEKNAVKLIDEFVEKNKHVPDFELTWAFFDYLANDPFPRRDTIQLGARLLTTRQGEKKYAEANAVQRLAKLAERFDDASWPVALIRTAILLIERGEQASSRWRSSVWLTSPLQTARQKRHDAELMLHARGFARLSDAEPLFNEALRAVDGVLSQQDTIEGAERLMQDALVLLPGYVACLEHKPMANPFWHQAAHVTGDLQTLLSPPDNELAVAERNARINEIRVQEQKLRNALARLRDLHRADVLDDLFTRLKRPDADVKLLMEFEAQLAIPFHNAETRSNLWQARGTLAKKIADKLPDDTDEPTALTARSETEELQELVAARNLRKARAARSLTLLRLAGVSEEDFDGIEKHLTDFASIKNADLHNAPPEIRDGCALAAALRHVWANNLVRQTADAEPRVLEQISRGAPAWLRFGAEEDRLSKAAWLAQQIRERRLNSILADRYRHESTEPLASPFVGRAAFALREFAPPDVGLTLPAAATRVNLTPMAPSATVNIPLRWPSLPKMTPPITVDVLTADDDWLIVTPKFDALSALATAPRDQPGMLELPVQVTLKPQAELSASPRPSGFLLRFESGGRSYHHAIELPLLPSAERLEVIVSADPKDPSVPFGDLRLRPSQERQAYFVYVNNRGKLSRNLTVELRAGDRVLPGGTVNIIAPPEQATRVVFGLPVPSPSAPIPKGEGAPAAVKTALPELMGPLLVRLLDRERKDEQVATREIRVDLADPREYVRVPSIRFDPGNSANKVKNRLDLTVQTARHLTGRPVAVELIVPSARIVGLKAVRAGIFRGELPGDGEPLKLFAGEFEFDVFADDTGPVYLTVDGIERAFIFRTTFAPVGEPTIPREELRPALRVSAGRFYKTNTKFEAVAEVDQPPANAQLHVSLGQMRGGVFEAEIKAPVRSAREKRIGTAIRGIDGGVEFDTVSRDWRVPFDAVPVRGQRVVQARLVDTDGQDIVPPAYTQVLFDDRAPERVAFVELPKQIKRDVPFLLKATGIDQATGIKEVSFFFGKPTEDGKLPQGAVKIEASLSKKEPNVWQASINWQSDKKGPIDVSVMFTNRLDLSAFVKESIELVDFDPVKSAPGTIEGVVVEGTRIQVGVAVVLLDAKGNTLAEQKTKAGGAFAFTNLAPGVYTIRATKPTAGTPLVGAARVELAPGKSKRLTIALFL